jgi:endonuclease YncB( thermonuclease family)
MERGGRDRRGDWISPEAYDALSPEEKRAIWNERKRRPRAKRPTGTGGNGPGASRSTWLGYGTAAALIAGITAWEASRSRLFDSSDTASPVRASFALCHTGGGTNCVVDGDTIWVAGENVRVADIDAPETHDFRCPEEKALGDRATQRLHQLVNGGAVSLRPIGDRDADGYGRKLRVVLVNGRSVGDTLVGEGLARSYGGGKRPWC